MPLQWFQTWFNSPYYHVLYNKHDHQEAENFINNLFSYLNPRKGAQILDIACGRGRHAVCINEKGFTVTGIDLSISNIEYARQFENDTLHFYVHDMRQLAYSSHFDIALNLFTSFGYFETEAEHITALKAFNKALKTDGLLVLDFFNSHKIIQQLVADACVTAEGIDFKIHKQIEDKKIIKTITFKGGNQNYNFNEKVNTFTADDFMRFFDQSGFKIIEQFGSYSLTPFDIENSDRLIFIVKKQNN